MFFTRKSLWRWRSSTTIRSAKTMPSGRSSLAAKPQAQRSSTGLTCWPTRAAPSLNGIPSNRRKTSTVLWLPLMPRSNLSHLNLTNQLTNQPANAWHPTLNRTRSASLFRIITYKNILKNILEKMNNITCSPHSVNWGRRNGHVWSETTFANNIVHPNRKRKMALEVAASRMIFHTAQFTSQIQQ